MSPSKSPSLQAHGPSTGPTLQPEAGAVPELIQYWTNTTPAATAVEYPGGRLTYAELDTRVAGLAARLRELTAGKAGNIGLLLPRSPELIISILACWRAGQAYVPLPVDTPGGRLAYLMEDGDCGLILTDVRHREKLSGDSPPVLLVDRGTVDHVPPEHAVAHPAPDTAAYIMYTSGSTGRPKGVVIEHGALANYIAFARRRYVRNAAPAFPLFTSIGFDLTVTSLFTPLASGGKIAVYPEPTDGSPDLAVLQVMEENRCEVVKLTPAHLALLSGGDYRRNRLTTLIVGGEQFTTELARNIRQRLPAGAEIINEYGPTEATVGCIVKTYVEATDRGTAVPIGRPIENTEAYLLDGQLQPVGAGAIGELYLGGRSLARAYWRRPDLTAERFIPHPFSPGDRLYCTGDRARYSPEGELEFLGRKDRQVKWRGFRIELDEIEQLLLAHPGVSGAAVALGGKQPAGGDDPRRLVAYYTATVGASPEDLHPYLASHLPAYSLPQQLIALPELPLTPAGKVDRRALADRNLSDPEPAMTFAAPVGEIEELLATIWSEVLTRDRIGRHDPFLDLGGHSLSAIRLAARISEAFQFEVPLHRIFELPTIALQANFLEETLVRLLADTDNNQVDPT